MFVLLSGYVKTKSYSIAGMEQREVEIRTQAEQIVSNKLSIHRRLIFNWILFHARRGVRHRENLRFARTKLFGVFRDLFRAIGDNLVDLGLLKERQDVFYLTVEEIFAFVEGRAVTNNIPGLVELRREEYNGYRKVESHFIINITIYSIILVMLTTFTGHSLMTFTRYLLEYLAKHEQHKLHMEFLLSLLIVNF